jgi:hypothetical protein
MDKGTCGACDKRSRSDFEESSSTSSSIDVVIIPDDESKEMTLQNVPKDYTGMKKSLDMIIGATCEFHVSSYFIREQLPTDCLKTLHEKLTFACDENGSYKLELGYNKRASQITGLNLKGIVVMFIEQDDDEYNLDEYDDLEQAEYDVDQDLREENQCNSNLSLDQVTELWNATKDLTIY